MTPITESSGRWGAVGHGRAQGQYTPGPVERERRGTPAFPQALRDYNSPLPDDIGVSAPGKFNRASHQTAPAIQTGVKLSANNTSNKSSSTKSSASNSYVLYYMFECVLCSGM